MTTQRTLPELEKALATKTKPSTANQIFFGGIGLISDGYNAHVVSSASLVLSRMHPLDLTTDLKTRLSQAYFVGVILGEFAIGLHGIHILLLFSPQRRTHIWLSDRSNQSEGRRAHSHCAAAAGRGDEHGCMRGNGARNDLDAHY